MATQRRMSDIKVEEIMTAQVFTISPQMTVKEAINLILDKKIGGAPVVDLNKDLVSMISEGTLLKLAALSGVDTTIQKCMDKLIPLNKIVTAKKTDSMLDVYKIFLAHPIHRIPIVDGSGKLQGIIARGNVLKVFLLLGAS
jgi:acetoin utilization protein AcuB